MHTNEKDSSKVMELIWCSWGGDVNDAIQFIITNFIEMNKLWVRMQYQRFGREQEKRERERREMATLVFFSLLISLPSFNT
jgi:hypothetical protein